jgi:hypothetical protein
MRSGCCADWISPRLSAIGKRHRIGCFRPSQHELRDVGADRQLDPEAGVSSTVVIILGKPLSYFTGAKADHGTGIGIVIGIAPENRNPQSALFYLAAAAVESGIDKESEQSRITLAAAELMAGDDCVELLTDQLTICCGDRPPMLCGIRRSRHNLAPNNPIKGEAYTLTVKIVTLRLKAGRNKPASNRRLREVRQIF